MANPGEIKFRGKTGLYWSVSGLRELVKADSSYKDRLKEEHPGHVWFTVYHGDSDWSEPVLILRKVGAVNRLGFIFADPDFIGKEALELTGRTPKDVKFLRSDLRELESSS
jgi:hypothetical protein